MNYDHMGDLISTLRKEKNMTQKELADLLNITDKAVSKWERGLSCPDINTIPKLARTLGISSEELLNIQEQAEGNDATRIGETIPKKIRKMSTLIFKAVGLAMGIAVLVSSIMNSIDVKTAILLLSLGLSCIGLAAIQNE